MTDNSIELLLKTFKEEIIEHFDEGKEELSKQFEIKLEKINKKITKFQKTADDALKIANDAKVAANLNKVNLENLRKDFDIHVGKYDEFSKKCEHMEKELSLEKVRNNVLSVKLEDSINKNCRKTLVFKGLKEEGKEKWSDTKSLLSNVLADVMEEDPEVTFNWIERCHRSRPNKFKKGKRDIFAAFYDWNDSDTIRKKFRYNGNNSDSDYNHVVVDQKFGSDTTWRRDQALLKRKILKKQKKIYSGHVEYPAKLMVKYTAHDNDFVLFEDFSNIVVKMKKNEENDSFQEEGVCK